MINYADRDVHYLREQTIMLENQNRFLESEFQRQLDKIVVEKNEQISRLIHIIDQTCPPPSEYTDHVSDVTHSSGTKIFFISQKKKIFNFIRKSRSSCTKIYATKC
jgi:hypothetical protein